MHVNGKKLAVSGLLAAFSVVLVILAAVVEASSLFFIAAASFCVGIALREWGILYGAAFYVATVLLGFLVAPQKMYCFTFAGMGLYLIGAELLFHILEKKNGMKNRILILWIGKFIIFDLLYIPTLLFLPQLFIKKEMTGVFLWACLIAGQIALWVYDRAHGYVQIHIWGKFRGKLLGNY